jgi:hypothetical protein
VQQIEVDRSEAPQVMLARIGCSGPRRIVGKDFADQEQLAAASGDRFATSALAPLSAYISAVSTSVMPRSKPARSAAASSFQRRASSSDPHVPWPSEGIASPDGNLAVRTPCAESVDVIVMAAESAT